MVSERLGHAHPGFTMATYQHLIPGMASKAADDFNTMLYPTDSETQGAMADSRSASDRSLNRRIVCK